MLIVGFDAACPVSISRDSLMQSGSKEGLASNTREALNHVGPCLRRPDAQYVPIVRFGEMQLTSVSTTATYPGLQGPG